MNLQAARLFRGGIAFDFRLTLFTAMIPVCDEALVENSSGKSELLDPEIDGRVRLGPDDRRQVPIPFRTAGIDLAAVAVLLQGPPSVRPSRFVRAYCAQACAAAAFQIPSQADMALLTNNIQYRLYC